MTKDEKRPLTRLRDARLDRGWSQQELADEVGTTTRRDLSLSLFSQASL